LAWRKLFPVSFVRNDNPPPAKRPVVMTTDFVDPPNPKKKKNTWKTRWDSGMKTLGRRLPEGPGRHRSC